MLPNYPLLPPYLTLTSLPGPSRKRALSPYCYRLSYRNPDPAAAGCALLWEVYGGRLTYQVVLERKSSGKVEWHCTCADAIYRGETVPNHVCKHVRGLIAQGRPSCPLVKQVAEEAASPSP